MFIKYKDREKEEKLQKYIINIMVKNYISKKGELKRDTRPKHMVYLHCAKASGYTYCQIRWRFDRWVRFGIMEKFQAWNGKNMRKNYYRLTAGGEQFLDV